MQKEKKIYIRELLFKIFSNWRTIIIWMIVFAVLANIFFCVKYYRALSAAAQQKEQTEEIDISTYRNALSEDDAKEVENNFDMYLKHRNAYDKLMEYFNNSIYMNLDPNSVPIVQLEYNISNCDFAEDYINLLSGKIQNENTAKTIIDELNLDTDRSYIWELVEFIDAKQDTIQSNTTAIIQETDSNSLMMIVKVMGETLDSAHQMSNIINNTILSVTSDLRKQYGAVQIEKIGEIESTVVDDTLLIKQQDYSGRINNIKSYLENLKSSMTASQESYYNALIDNYEIDAGIQEKQIQQEVEQTESTMQYYNIKYIIVGLFLGAVLACCYVCFPYILGNKFETPYEVSDCFGIALLGTLTVENKKKRNNFIDKQINHYFRRDNINTSLKDKVLMIETNIEVICKKKGFRKIFVTSSIQTDKVKIIKDMLQNLGEKNEFELIMGKSILTDNNSLEQLSESEGVILIEEIASTNLADINEEVNICRKYDVPIIGMIVSE